MIVIGLSGIDEDGKFAACSRLVESHGFQAFAFADPLWELLSNAGVIDEDRLHEATYMRTAVEGIGYSPNKLAQDLGDEAHALNPNLLVHYADLALRLQQKLHNVQRAVFLDVRRTAEAQYVIEQGGEIWNVIDPFAQDAGDHVTEQGIQTELINRGILNDGALDKLYALVDTRVDQYLSGRK